MRNMTAIVAAFVTLITFSVPAFAANHRGSSIPTGNDVSYPQCSSRLPSGQAFGIVGVNDGLANNTNPCFLRELSWAQKSSGLTSQPKAALYVNTANPGNLGVADWPSNNLDPVTGVTVSDPHGTCAGGDDQACAWQYGWNMADLDAQRRGVPNPGTFKWWLDVETANSWETNEQNNTADLEGMVAYFKSIGANTGIYSTSYQWSQIAGTTASSSSLYGLSDWIPGARSLSGAEANCKLAPLTGGGRVSATQWFASVDGDYSCS